jgi:hypothetical protein
MARTAEAILAGSLCPVIGTSRNNIRHDPISRADNEDLTCRSVLYYIQKESRSFGVSALSAPA